jgi:hypothetical protein
MTEEEKTKKEQEEKNKKTLEESDAKTKKEQEENARKERDERDKSSIWRVIFFLILLGISFIAMISFQATSKSESQILEESFSKLSDSSIDSVKQSVEIIKLDTVVFNQLKEATKITERLDNYKLFFITFGTCLLIAGACFVSGAFTGFLFGIPRIINSSYYRNDKNKSDNVIVHNDNLVQISDWLTKIIVGIALTEIYKIPTFLNSIGEKISPTINPAQINEKSSVIVAIAIVLYFLILGFLAVYFWTRIYFGKILKDEISSTSESSTNNSNNEMAVSEKPIE